MFSFKKKTKQAKEAKELTAKDGTTRCGSLERLHNDLVGDVLKGVDVSEKVR